MSERASALAGVLVACEGGCGVLVRPENGFCDHCAELNRLLEDKRKRDEERRERYGVGEFGHGCADRIDMGLDEMPESRADRASAWIEHCFDRIDRQAVEVAIERAALVLFVLFVMWMCKVGADAWIAHQFGK